MKTVGKTLGYDKSSVSKSVRDVLQTLTDVSSKFIKWPSPAKEKMATKKGLYAIARFLAVIGAVDGTHVGIIAPS